MPTLNFVGSLPGDGPVDLKERIRSQQYERKCIIGERDAYDKEDEMYHVCPD